jgi:23S rRNA pseudouridine1911/1915/1917 synthase
MDQYLSLYTVMDNEGGERLDIFLAYHSGLSRARVKNLIHEGCAILSDGSILKPSYQVKPHDIIHFTVTPVSEPAFLPENIPLDIVFQDDFLIVVNKPPGMVVHPARGHSTGTLASALRYHCTALSHIGGAWRPGIVHRLDKDTSGLIIVALDDEVHRRLARMLHERLIEKIYTVFVWGHFSSHSGIIETPIGRHSRNRKIQVMSKGGKPAVTVFEVLEQYEFLSKLRVSILTGRTHQIRVHLASVGHHVFGDPVYGGREERLKGFNPEVRTTAQHLLSMVNRQALHAERLVFIHPMTGKELKIEAPLPEDLKTLQKMLRKNSE